MRYNMRYDAPEAPSQVAGQSAHVWLPRAPSKPVLRPEPDDVERRSYVPPFTV